MVLVWDRTLGSTNIVILLPAAGVAGPTAQARRSTVGPSYRGKLRS